MTGIFIALIFQLSGLARADLRILDQVATSPDDRGVITRISVAHDSTAPKDHVVRITEKLSRTESGELRSVEKIEAVAHEILIQLRDIEMTDEIKQEIISACKPYAIQIASKPFQPAWYLLSFKGDQAMDQDWVIERLQLIQNRIVVAEPNRVRRGSL